MFYARVLTGMFTNGDSSMKEAPLREGMLRYDSVANGTNPSIFVVFVDYAAYPDHLISFQ